MEKESKNESQTRKTDTYILTGLIRKGLQNGEVNVQRKHERKEVKETER